MKILNDLSKIFIMYKKYQYFIIHLIKVRMLIFLKKNGNDIIFWMRVACSISSRVKMQ
jgi:hypothetical protein